jgi:hypothetical protein
MPNGKLRRYWRCRCDCGTELETMATNLKQRPDPSCGCLQTEKLAVKNYKHGGATRGQTERLYEIWTGMLKRCRNPSRKQFKDYGGRGIGVDPAGTNTNLSEFGPSQRLRRSSTIERNDNDGDYTRNCRWLQGWNRRTIVGRGQENFFNGTGMFVPPQLGSRCYRRRQNPCRLHDIEDDGFVDGLSHCTPDGQSVIINNIR